MHVDDDRLFAAVRVGAAAYLTKDADPARIVETVHAVLRGENLLHQAVLTNPELARRVLGEFRTLSEGTSPAGTSDAGLSPRELEVLDCLVMGYSNKEIGEQLFITEQTVKNHMTAVLRKLKSAIGSRRFATPSPRGGQRSDRKLMPRSTVRPAKKQANRKPQPPPPEPRA